MSSRANCLVCKNAIYCHACMDAIENEGATVEGLLTQLQHANSKVAALEAENDLLKLEMRWLVADQGGYPTAQPIRIYANEERIDRLMAMIGLDAHGRRPPTNKD